MSDIVERLRFWGDSYYMHKEAADEIEKLRAALKEYDDAFEDWLLPFVEGRKDDPNEETKACERLVKAQRVARAVLGEKE
jgi:hypothetical protein